jgi:membrane associated rhomboid family serine protease
MGQPAGDAQPFPWLTAAIVAAWAAIYAAAWVTSADHSTLQVPAETIARWGANTARHTMDGEWWRLLANKFLFFDLKSLLVVGWAFWGAGQVVERVFGRLGLAAVFGGAALASSLAVLAFLPPNKVVVGGGGPTLGAFGAIVGYAVAVRSAALWPYLRPIRFSGPVFVVWTAWGMVEKNVDLATMSVGMLTGFLLGLTLAPVGQAPGVEKSRVAPWPFALTVIVLVLGAIWTQVKEPPYLASEALKTQAALRAFDEKNNALADRKTDLERRLRTASPPHTAFADELEKEHLPEWRRLRAELAAAPARPGIPGADYLAPMGRYLDAQVRLLEKAAEALRSGDPAQAEETRRLARELVAARDELRALSAKKEAERRAEKKGGAT